MKIAKWILLLMMVSSCEDNIDTNNNLLADVTVDTSQDMSIDSVHDMLITEDVTNDTDINNADLDDVDLNDTNLNDADLSPDDVRQDVNASKCGNGIIDSNETCDDSNVNDGDYCSKDCQTITGSCGDNGKQSNETCDDGVTNDCLTTHDGGDGICVAASTCSVGFMLQNGVCISSNTTGLTVPCSNGPGYTLFKIHYDSGSSSARIDVWDATCNYSLASNSACNVREVCRGFCDVPRTRSGNPIFNSSNYWRARFKANGLNFTSATLYVNAAGTRGSTSFRAWSPLYGDTIGGIISGYQYGWHSVDWTHFLTPTDQHSLTAIQIYGHNSTIAIKAVELCVQ